MTDFGLWWLQDGLRQGLSAKVSGLGLGVGGLGLRVGFGFGFGASLPTICVRELGAVFKIHMGRPS